MKIASLALFFLLLTFTKADFVYDTQGEQLSKAHSYHVTIGTELGRPYFTLENVGSESCPLSVIAAPLSAENPPRLGVKFSDNLPFPYPFAFTEEPLNFTFVGIPLCDKTSKWFAEERLGSNAWSLLFGVEVGRLTVEGDFIVQNYGEEYSYKIIFCPKERLERCRNLVLRDGKYLDIVDEAVDPLEIRFERVSSHISTVV